MTSHKYNRQNWWTRIQFSLKIKKTTTTNYVDIIFFYLQINWKQVASYSTWPKWTHLLQVFIEATRVQKKRLDPSCTTIKNGCFLNDPFCQSSSPMVTQTDKEEDKTFNLKNNTKFSNEKTHNYVENDHTNKNDHQNLIFIVFQVLLITFPCFRVVYLILKLFFFRNKNSSRRNSYILISSFQH